MNEFVDLFRKIAEKLYLPMVNDQFGQKGIEELRVILDYTHKIYRYVEPERYIEIIIFRTLNAPTSLFKVIRDIDYPDYGLLAHNLTNSLIIQIMDNGRAAILDGLNISIEELSKIAIIYQYRNGVESFWANSCYQVVEKLPQFASMFCVPTFRNLRRALDAYHASMIRNSGCKIFSRVWYNLTNRIFFLNAPEATIRDSLIQFLRTTFGGDADVRPEQNIDESHPVDIKVSWSFTNRQALIEIKWLGKSINHQGKIVSYWDQRARNGAKQLSDYLDANKPHAPFLISRGYLVIIDGRRRGANQGCNNINIVNGFYYRDKEVIFNPNYHEIRDDFEIPFRMFAEPICV